MDNNNNNGYYESPENNQQMYNNMGTQPSNINAPDYMLWLVLGIVQIILICCCNCFSFITGIITVLFVITANSAYQAGDMAGYMSKIKVAKIVNIIGWALMVVNMLIGIFGGLFDFITSLFA